jgi:hypothetical protein
MRGQTSLPALGLALLVLTAATFLGVAVAHGALAGADRAALDRQAAVALSDRLTAGDARLTLRENTLNASRLDDLSASALRGRYGLDPDADVSVRLDDRTLASAGQPRGGVTVRRVVLVARHGDRTFEPSLDGTRAVTLPRRVDSVTLTLSPDAGTTVRRIRANGRVVLQNASGLDGTFDVAVSPYETTRLRVDAVGGLDTGALEVTLAPERTEKRLLVVTVDG